MESQSAEVVVCCVSAVAAIIAIIVAYRSNKAQMQISMFAEFTRRYQEIMLHIRKNDEDKEYYQTLYIDLCSEEYFMHNRGYLPKEVWTIWKDGMEHEVKGGYFELWQRNKDGYNLGFQKFFSGIVTNDTKAEENNNQ